MEADAAGGNSLEAALAPYRYVDPDGRVRFGGGFEWRDGTRCVHGPDGIEWIDKEPGERVVGLKRIGGE